MEIITRRHVLEKARALMSDSKLKEIPLRQAS
jgi:hypothetical protein